MIIKIQQKVSAMITSMATKMIPNTGKIKSKNVSTQLSNYSLDIKVQPQIPTSTLAPNLCPLQQKTRTRK